MENILCASIFVKAFSFKGNTLSKALKIPPIDPKYSNRFERAVICFVFSQHGTKFKILFTLMLLVIHLQNVSSDELVGKDGKESRLDDEVFWGGLVHAVSVYKKR